MENKKIFLKWWLAAAVVYLAFGGAAVWFYGADFLMPANDDSAHHMKLAENLIKYKTFSLDGLYSSEEPKQPLAPTNFLTPGYAFWLALIYLIFKSFVPAIFIGALIFSLSVPLTYFLAKEIADNKKISFWSALIFTVEPLSIYHSGLLFTEQIFVPLFLAGIYYFVKYIKGGGSKLLLGSLITLSAATLIRPVLFYFLPFLVLIVIFKELKISWRRATVLGALSVFLAYSVVGIWIIRNKIVLNTWRISSNAGAILFGYHYEPLARSLGLKPENQNVLGGGRDIFSVEYNKILEKFALGEIIKRKAQYLKLRLAYVPLFFLSNGYDNIYSRLTGVAGFDKYFRWNLISSFQKGNILLGIKMLLNAPKTIVTILAGALFWLLIFLSAIIGFWRLLKEREKYIIIFTGLLIIYFAFITTPIITARYRLPINPFIFIFAVSGFLYFKQLIRKNA